MKQLCALYGCVKSRTTPYHPQGNGAVERFNQTLLALLSSLPAESQAQWPARLPALVQAYNNTVHGSTGLTPHFVVFGRHARLPVDLGLGVQPSQPRLHLDGWVQQHHRTLTEAYRHVKPMCSNDKPGTKPVMIKGPGLHRCWLANGSWFGTFGGEHVGNWSPGGSQRLM